MLAMKARWLAAEKKLDEALQRAQAAVEADPQSAGAHFTLALIQERRGDVSSAAKEYNEVLRLNPRATAAQVELSRLSLTSGEEADAVRYAQAARQAQPSSGDARVALARGLIASGNLARAEAEIAELLKAAPNAAIVHSLNGMLLAAESNACGTKFVRAGALRFRQISSRP